MIEGKRTRRYRLRWMPVLWLGVCLTAAAVAALYPLESDSREQVYEIPKGTWARRMAGENLAILPATIRLTLGIKDVLVLRNRDDVPQLFGPVLIMPGQSFALPFRVASVYLFACTLHVSGQLSVVVVPKPETPWERIRWRVGGMLQPRISA